MMGKLGFDIKLEDMSKPDEAFCREAVQNYNRLKGVILDGDQYRLVSPYEGNHASTLYVSKDVGKAVLFGFDMYPRYAERSLPVQLQGLDADRMYRVTEINLMPGARSTLRGNGKLYSGDFLMKVGLNLFGERKLQSRVVELTAE
jgi:alpha-galactosidase